MSSATVQAKITAFESLAASSSSMVFLPANRPRSVTENLLETPISPTTANALLPVAHFTSRSASRHPSKPSPSPSPPNLGQKTSLIDLRDWVVEDEFSETTTPARHSQPTPSALTRNGKQNGNVLKPGATESFFPVSTPLITLDSPPKVKPKPKHLVSKPVALAGDAAAPLKARNTLRSVASASSLRSSTTTSYLYTPHHNDSSNVDRSHTYPPKLNANHRPGHAPASSISSFHSVSLSSDTDPSTSGSSSQRIAAEQEKDHDLSVKSYGSDTVSLDESYEEVSSTFVGSPATERLINLDWERASAQWKSRSAGLPQRRPTGAATTKPPTPQPSPPKVPPRSTPSISSSSSTSTLANSFAVVGSTSRRAPPPPSRSSDRSSILSSATSDSAFSVNYATYQSNHNKVLSHVPAVQINSINIIQKARRPTPIPPKARKRYEDLFDANVLQWRRAEKRRKGMPAMLTPQEARQSRRAIGWRGLSIDLTTVESKAEEDEESEEVVDGVVGSGEVLEGGIIRCIWTRSGLDKKKLHGIWNECNLSKTGVLNREGFVKGMWKIDEELRRASSHQKSHTRTLR